VLRLTEIAGRSGPVTATLPFCTIGRAWRTDLVERNQAPLPCQPHSVATELVPFGIATLRLQRP